MDKERGGRTEAHASPRPSDEIALQRGPGVHVVADADPAVAGRTLADQLGADLAETADTAELALRARLRRPRSLTAAGATEDDSRESVAATRRRSPRHRAGRWPMPTRLGCVCWRAQWNGLSGHASAQNRQPPNTWTRPSAADPPSIATRFGTRRPRLWKRSERSLSSRPRTRPPMSPTRSTHA